MAIRVFLRWCVRNHYLDRSPLEAQQLPARNRSRERVLNGDELGAVYRKALAYPFPYGRIISLLILTGQRRGEIGALQWSWIKEDTITLPGSITKNKRTHTFPLGTFAKSLVETIPETGPYLFPAARSHIRGKPTTHFNGWAKAKPLFDKESKIEPFTLHDLRRTFSSHLAALGVPLHVTEKLLNHSSGSLSGVAAIYNRHTYLPEMRLAIDNWEKHLAGLLTS